LSQSNTYVIGDIQGCYEGLRRILDKVKFNPDSDTLLAVGDLVARGEDSLSTLRFLKSLGNRFSSVLGNHDLHLLSVINGLRKAKKSDNLSPLLKANDLQELTDWLRQFPLVKQIAPNTIMVHAGLYPQWSIDEAVNLSDEVSKVLRANNYAEFLSDMYGNEPNRWDNDLQGKKRLRFVVNACTRMRFIENNNALDFEHKSHPGAVANSINSSLQPWFNVDNPKLDKNERVVFGHWAALSGQTQNRQFIGLDTGYVWGQSMTMLNLNSNELIQIDA